MLEYTSVEASPSTPTHSVPGSKTRLQSMATQPFSIAMSSILKSRTRRRRAPHQGAVAAVDDDTTRRVIKFTNLQDSSVPSVVGAGTGAGASASTGAGSASGADSFNVSEFSQLTPMLDMSPHGTEISISSTSADSSGIST
jgi:hypothetical protein